MHKLEALGTEQTKQTLLRHGAAEPLFGVKIGDLKKLAKDVKKDQSLALQLFESGNDDAMYLAGLSVNPKLLSIELLRHWALQADCHTLAECTVAGVAAESGHGRELALEWIDSEEEMVAACGWSTYTNWLSITPDDRIDSDEVSHLLGRVAATIHQERNRVRYTMNGFVIGAGSFYKPLYLEALAVAAEIGSVQVDMGDTACKVPAAAAYIAKVEQAGKLWAKRKTCIC